jgi:hypothetical protein
MKNNSEYHINRRMMISFLILAIVVALFSWLMFFGVKTENPVIGLIIMNVSNSASALSASLSLWYLISCLTTCFSGIMIRPLFSDGRSGLWFFILISWSYWIIGGCIVCIFIAIIIILILLSNGYHWLENFVRPIESVVILGIPYSLFAISLVSFHIVKFCPKALAWLVGTIFLAVACIGAGLTFVYIMSNI